MLILIVLVLSLYDLTSTYRALVGKETLYKLLNGLPISATEKEVKREWRRMSLIYHPDVAAGVGVAKSRLKEIEDRFMQMKEAYEVLGNPVKRFAYDRFGVEGLWMTTAKQQQTPAGGPAVPGALVAPPPSVAGVVWLGTFEVSQRYFAKLGAWGLWIWMMSWGKWGGDSRYWQIYMIIATFVLEIYIVTRTYNPLTTLLHHLLPPPQTLPHHHILQFQQCAILRRLVFLCGHIFEHICAATAAERSIQPHVYFSFPKKVFTNNLYFWWHSFPHTRFTDFSSHPISLVPNRKTCFDPPSIAITPSVKQNNA